LGKLSKIRTRSGAKSEFYKIKADVSDPNAVAVAKMIMVVVVVWHKCLYRGKIRIR
jgi:hypothetical protein